MDDMEDDAQGQEGDTIPRDHDYALAPDPQIFTLAFDENMSLREQSHQPGSKRGAYYEVAVQHWAYSSALLRLFMQCWL